jgi:hypothetical protein
MAWDADVYASRHWKNLSRFVRFERARGYCEECGVGHGTITEDGTTVVLLTCAHVNGESTDLRLENLRALCPRCHKLLDLQREEKGAGAGAPSRRRRRARWVRSGGTAGSRQDAKAQRTAGRRTGGRGEMATGRARGSEYAVRSNGGARGLRSRV